MEKVVLVTGASRGIGREIAKQLAEEGYIVIANYNKSEKQAQKLQQELQEKGMQIDIYKADVSKRAEVKEMIKFIINKYKKIDAVINNAGISESSLFIDIDDTKWNKILNNNLYSAYCVTQEALPIMIHRKQGSIINISSVWGMVGGACETVYSIAKAGMDAMTKSLAKELGPSNIRVNSIAPGIIDTDMNKNLSEEEINKIKEEIPLGRIGKTSDVAKCVKWLIEDEYTTGQIISLNGGWIIT